MIKSIYSFISKIILIVASLLFISGCENVPCVDADDFGFPKFSIDSRGETIYGAKDNQVTSWTDSKYLYNGDKLLLMVRAEPDSNNIYSSMTGMHSRWSPWLGGPGMDDIPTNIYADNANLCEPDPGICPNPSNPPPVMKFKKIPCIFDKGLGLYMLITDKTNGTGPNDNENVIRSPASINALTYHLGDNTNLFSDDGKPTGGYNGFLDKDRINGRLYFKILDRFYEDNAGKYQILVKSGISKVSPGPFNTVITYVTDTLEEATEVIYKHMIQNSMFISTIKILLSIYVIITGILFMFGLVQMTQGEFFIRFFKIAIIIQLTATETSWSFFYDRFFYIFMHGVEDITNIISQAISSGGGTKGLTIFDAALDLFTSNETEKKLQALFFKPPFVGLLYFVLIYIAIFFVFVAFIKAMVFYLLTRIAVAILIILAPIFICFILFQVTKELFDNWIKFLITYNIQPLILLVGIGMMTILMQTQFQKLLGFKVCPTGKFEVLGVKFFNYWEPVPVDTSNLSTILVPTFKVEGDSNLLQTANALNSSNGTVNNSTGNSYNITCKPYECYGQRYADLPFLDPVDDKDRINQIKNGQWIDYLGTFYLFIYIFIMIKFNESAQDLGRALGGGFGLSQTKPGGVAKEVLGNAFGVLKFATGTTLKVAGVDVGKTMKGLRKQIGEMQGIQYLNSARQFVGGVVRFATNLDNPEMGLKAMRLLATVPAAVIGGGVYGAMKLHEARTGTSMEKHKGRISSGLKLLAGTTQKPIIGGDMITSPLDERIKRGGERIDKAIGADKRGKYFDSMSDISKMMKNHAISKATGGIFGQDALKPKKQGMTRSVLENVIDRTSQTMELEDSQSKKILEDKLKSSVTGINGFAKGSFAALAMANPYVAGVVGAGMLTKTVLDTRKAIKELKKDIPDSGQDV